MGDCPGGIKKVLIIDDEPDTVLFLTAWLEDEGYETCSAYNGEEGLRVLQDERPDLVLMDLKMPGSTGMHLYREIFRQRELKKIPVIFISGMVDVKIFDDNLTPLPEPAARLDKPIDLEALKAEVVKALG